jgi:predicted transposase/invertase (TIGR01784 family)
MGNQVNKKEETMRGKYLNPKADLTFKKIFGEHPNLVISLLNALLPLKEDERIEHIEYWPAEKIPRRTQAEKDSIVDVCCHDSKKREFIVEMQMTWTEAFKKRVLLNASKAYVAQSEVGEVYQRLQPVYALNFVNESMNLDTEGYYHHYQLVHQEKSDEVIDGLQLVFIELPKFQPQSFSDKRMQVLWLRFLTEINENTQEAPDELLENLGNPPAENETPSLFNKPQTNGSMVHITAIFGCMLAGLVLQDARRQS